MKRYRLQILLFTLILLILPKPGMPQDNFTFGIQANQTAIEVLGEVGFYLQPSTFYVGANGVYFEDRYSMGGLHAMVGNVVAPGLTGKIGFKGAAGKFKRSGIDDPNLYALAFSISGRYDLSEVIAAHYIPVILHATVSIAPKPLSFDDTERFFETTFGADWMFLENAAITASYRFVDAKFEEWRRSHGGGYLGFKFIF